MPLPESSRIVAFVGASSLAEAKRFYVERLGLSIVSEDPFALTLNVQGTMLRVTPVGKVIPAEYTVLGWEVDDIRLAVEMLSDAGVALERFAGIGQDEAGIWTAPGSRARIAWFKDPSGNLLSVSQHL